jgi:galactokinase/galacturonokinase
MRVSGERSIHNYEAGSPHLITLHEILNRIPGVYGARFSGAGFGGSCLALARPEAREQIIATVANEYPQAHPDIAKTYSVHFCGTMDAAEVV